MAEVTPEIRLLAALPQGLIACDRQQRITFINLAATRLLGLDVDRWLGQPIDALCAHVALPSLAALAAQRRAIYINENKLYVQTLMLPHTSRRAESDIAIMLSPEDAEQRAMTDLICTVSHEVRTPLTVIRGFSELLLRGLAGEIDIDVDEQRACVEMIRQRASDTTALVNNAILIAGLDAGTLTTEREPVDLQRAIEETLDPFRSPLEAKGLSLTVDLAGDLPPALGDFVQLQVALRQLLDNARRYTSAGGIIVRAIARAETILIQVEDSGCGIAPEVLPRIFERFVRHYPANDESLAFERGVGLGLAICKQLVERQGGTISVTSALGQGSCFSIALPTAVQC